MKPLQILCTCGVLAYGFHSWHVGRAPAALGERDGYAAGDFQAIAMPREAQRDTVLIVAPVDCPSNAARTRRTKALAAELTRRGIPNMTTTTVSFIGDPGGNPADDRMNAVMEAGPPVVFVNGLGKANPSPDEVEDALHRSRSGS